MCRVFLYKWTVNWKMLPEATFLHPALAKALLVLHVLALGLFAWRTGLWGRVRASSAPSSKRTSAGRTSGAARAVSTAETLTTVWISGLIGMVCARSLHYQFYSWYFHTVPYLLWQTQLPVAARLGCFAAMEWCWNVFPAGALSSSVLLGVHAVLLSALFQSCGRLHSDAGARVTADAAAYAHHAARVHAK